MENLFENFTRVVSTSPFKPWNALKLHFRVALNLFFKSPVRLITSRIPQLVDQELSYPLSAVAVVKLFVESVYSQKIYSYMH